MEKLTIDKFYEARLAKQVLTEQDIKKAMEDWATLENIEETKQYARLVEKIKQILSTHLVLKLLEE